MQPFENAVSQHEAIKQQVKDAPNTVQLEQIVSLLKETRQAGATTANTQDREQLRDVLRYWGNYLNSNYDVYPDMHLLPFEGESSEGAAPHTASTPTTSDSTQQIQISSEPVQSKGFSQLKWVFILMIGMIVLFFIIQVVFPPAQVTEAPTITAVPNETMVASVTETSLAIVRDETATAVSMEPSTTPTLEVIYVTATATATPKVEIIEHTVETGDTLFSIAKTYNVDMEAIQAANNLESETITVGDVLTIEIVTTPTPFPTVENATGEEETASEPVQSIPVDANTVIRGDSATGTTILRVAPEPTAKEIQTLNSGAFVYTVGKTEDDAWVLLELNGRTVRGWVPAAEINLLYPFTPEEIPVIQTP